jgi:hypothetical protein
MRASVADEVPRSNTTIKRSPLLCALALAVAVAEALEAPRPTLKSATSDVASNDLAEKKRLERDICKTSGSSGGFSALRSFGCDTQKVHR